MQLAVSNLVSAVRNGLVERRAHDFPIATHPTSPLRPGTDVVRLKLHRIVD